MTLRTLNYGNYGIFLIMGNAGFCPSAVAPIRALRLEAASQGFGNDFVRPRTGMVRDLQGRRSCRNGQSERLGDLKRWDETR